MGRTTISISDELADKLHELKDEGDSYEDVIRRLLQIRGKENIEEAVEGTAPEELADIVEEVTGDVDYTKTDLEMGSIDSNTDGE